MNRNSEFEFIRKSFGVLQRIASIEFDQAKSKWSTLQYAERAFESVHLGRGRSNEKTKRKKRSKSEHGRTKYRRKNLSTSDLLVYSVSSGKIFFFLFHEPDR